ncbi:MAG: tRNA (cytidine(34)-2'-O)-methyltransferase [Arenimonas sp.]
MIELVLYQPEIAPNTGNVIRLCANTGARLHLVAPLGFELDDARLRRAGLDYHEFAEVRVHDSLDAALHGHDPARVFAFSTRARTRFDRVDYRPGDVLVFGPESRGLPAEVLAAIGEQQCLRLPMRAGQRSLNLSNAVAVAVFEAWRQLDYSGGAVLPEN